MKQSINFHYDGVYSQDMDVHIAWNSSGAFEENFLPNRRIIEKKIANREKPYFQRVEHEPLSFPLSFAICNLEDEEAKRKLARWLFQPYYKPLIFSSNPNRVFYAMIEGDSKLIHNGAMEAYIELNIRCDSPYAYTYEKTQELIEFRNTNTGSEIIIDKTNFTMGTLDNMIVTPDGLTIEETLTNWGNLYASSPLWGGVI